MLRPATCRASLALVALAVAGCSSGQPGPAPQEPTTAQPTAAPTTAQPTASPTGADVHPNLAVLLEDYPASDEWVVETVVRDIPAGTGGLAIAADGTMYQADFGAPGEPGDRVLRISPDGEWEVFAQSDDFSQLTMTVLAPDGRLYQSSYGSDRVFVIDAEGNVELLAEDIDGATGLVLLDDGSVLVEAYDGGSIHRIGPDGTVETLAEDILLNGPNGMVRTPDGTLYAINHRDGGLNRIEEDGTVTRVHTFPRPTSHVAHLDGKLYITSRGAYVIYEYDPTTDEAMIIAGSGVRGDADGRGIESAFGRPNAIAVGPDGHLYFNHRSGEEIGPLTIRRLVRSPQP